jgi:hypothetical protein
VWQDKGLMVEIVLDKEYTGPTIVELATTIPDITDTVIKLRWTNTKDELHTLAQFKRDFLLIVPDSLIFDKAVATFGKPLNVSQSILERSKLVLADRKGYDWRHFSEELHESISPKYLLLKLAADAIRKGIQPSLAEIVGKVFLDGISPTDADVLIRLRAPRMRG